MASCISYHDQFFYVSNKRFDTLIEFGLDVGQKAASSDAERVYVTELRKRRDGFFPGYDLIIETEFPTREERKFWSRVFYDLAHLIFRREIGNQEISFWQHSAIGDAYIIGRMMTRSVQEEEQGWSPQTMASLEADMFFGKGINVKL